MHIIKSIISYTFATAAGACLVSGVYVLVGGANGDREHRNSYFIDR